MSTPFQTCIIFEEIPGTSPADISGPWDMAEVPVALLVHPFDSDASHRSLGQSSPPNVNQLRRPHGPPRETCEHTRRSRHALRAAPSPASAAAPLRAP